ncbi:MAG: FecR domain-containing protein [Polyangiaceae bacterium]
MSAERSPEETALVRLVSELRAEPTPEVDWQRVEARLMREPKLEVRTARAQFMGRLRMPAFALVAAAAAAFVLTRHHAPAPTASGQVVAKLAGGPLNGDQLALGTRITAGNHNVVVDHPGRARWTLEPRSTAFVSNSGEFLTVQLENGALSAAVVTSTQAETFAVEAGGTRVAVHGTAFRVERAADRVLVQVSEGTVAVEPTQTHSDPSFLLRRDSRGNFALDGRTGSVEGNASVVVRDAGRESRREIAAAASALQPAHVAHAPAHVAATTPTTAPRPASSTAADPPALPLQPSISNIEDGVSSAIGLLTGCFRNKQNSAGNVVSASTGMTLAVAGAGTVQFVTFSPPLEPAVEDCAVLGLRQLTFAGSVEGVTFTRILELTR